MWRLAALLMLCLPQAAEAVTCREDSFESLPFTLCEVSAADDLQLFLKSAEGETYGSFRAIDQALDTQGKRLAFAMNAGMYHRDMSPVGLFLSDGVVEGDLVTREGPGNFGMLPNGVFCWADGSYYVVDSREYDAISGNCRYATQSGPLLVDHGNLHPRFLIDSTSTYIRNGVGVSEDNTRAAFVITDAPVNFHRFARLFRDHLGLPNALYFDGNISRLYAPQLGRHDGGFPLGPIVGVVADKD